MSKIFSRWLSISEAEDHRDPCRLIDLVVIDSVVSEDDHGTTTLTSLRLDPCVDLTRLLSKGKIQAHLASHLYEVVGLTDTVTLEHLYISDHEDHFTLSMSHPSTESLIGGTVAAYESGKVVFFPVFQSTSKRLVETRVYLTHEFTKTSPPHSEDKSTDSYGSTPRSLAQHRVAETSYAFAVIDGYRQLSEDDLEEASVWFLTHRGSGRARRLMVDCPKGYRPHTLVVEYWEGPSELTGDNEVIAKVAVSLIPANEVSLHAIPRDDWNLTQGAVPSFYVDVPYLKEPTNLGTYRYPVGDHRISVRYSAAPEGGLRVRMFLPTDMDLPNEIILAWSKDPTLGIPHHPLVESTKEPTVSKEPVVDKSTKVNKETKMTKQRTEHKVEQPTPKDGLIWTSKLNLSGDHPEGIVMVAGQCRILDSDGLVIHKYRELEDRPVSAKVIRQYSGSTYDYVGHVLELSTPKGWVPQNIWLHVITSTEYPRLPCMELYCDFRIESTEEERAPVYNLFEFEHLRTESGLHYMESVLDFKTILSNPQDATLVTSGNVLVEEDGRHVQTPHQELLDQIKWSITGDFKLAVQLPEELTLRSANLILTWKKDAPQLRLVGTFTKNPEVMSDRSADRTAQIKGWHFSTDNIMDSGPLFQVPDDYRPGLSSRPILVGKVVLESGQELGRETAQTILESIGVRSVVNMFSKRLSVSLAMPREYQVRPMTGTVNLVRLPDQDAYQLLVNCDFTFIPPNPFQHTCGRQDHHVEVTKVTQSQEDTTVESPNDPTLFDTLFHSCKFVTEAVSTEHSIELELPYGYHTNRIAIISTQNPKDQSYVHSRAQLSPSLIKRNEYLLRLVTAPGVVISDVRHRLDQEDNILIQVDIHRPQDTETLSVNPDPRLPSDGSPKSDLTEDTVDNQLSVTPKQLMKEIYVNRDRKVDEILQSVNNYFTRCVREELATDPDLKLVLESPVPEDLEDRLHHALIDAGYVVEIDNEKLNFTVELPSIE